MQRGQLEQLAVPPIGWRSTGHSSVAAHAVDNRGRRRGCRRIRATDTARNRHAVGADQQIQTVVQAGRLAETTLE